jgi:hypothetical protein
MGANIVYLGLSLNAELLKCLVVQRRFNTLDSILVLVEVFDPRVLYKGSSGANIGKLMELICGLCSASCLLRSGTRVISLPLSSLGWCTSVAFCNLASKRLTLFFITVFPFDAIFWGSVTGASYISSITVTD